MKSFLFALPIVAVLGIFTLPNSNDSNNGPILGLDSPPQQVIVPSEEPAWHDNHQMIAHALGEIDGYAETNCLEAFYASYDKGIRIFEADFQLTSDNHLVVRHDFEQISYYNLQQEVLNGDTSMDLERFVSEKIIHQYTSLTAKDLIALLVEHEDAYLVTDSKDLEPEIVQEQFRQLVDIVLETGNMTLFDRIIVQIYNEDMFTLVQEIYPFHHWIFTLYQLVNPDMKDVGAFCVEKGIEVVTMPHSSATTEKSNILHGYGLKVFTHTINEQSDVIHGKNNGVDGFYTDFLLPEDFYINS